MSHPFGLEPDEVKDEDHVDPEVEAEKAEAIRDGLREDGDARYENEMDVQKEQNDKAMEDHFTKEPERFGGDGTNWN